MRRTLGVLSLLLSTVFLNVPASAQETGDPGPPGQQVGGFQLEQNYPNPFNPETTIPFILGEELFVEGRPAVVTMRVFNLLQQPVAVPVALRHPRGEGAPMVQLEYTASGKHEAFWDGRDSEGRQVASGIYFLQLTVNGQSKLIRMFVTK